jgi:hypothetical protein
MTLTLFQAQATTESRSHRVQLPNRRTIIKAQKSSKEIEALLSVESPSLNLRLNRIFDGSLMQAELNAQREADI